MGGSERPPSIKRATRQEDVKTRRGGRQRGARSTGFISGEANPPVRETGYPPTFTNRNLSTGAEEMPKHALAELSDMRALSGLTLVLKDLRTLSFVRDILCEFAGTTLFLFVGLASVVLRHRTPGPEGGPTAVDSPAAAIPTETLCIPDSLHVGVAFGASLALVAVCLGPATSGGVHLNPAVTLAMAVGLRVTPWRAVLYVGAQLLGSLCACGLLLGLAPAPQQGRIGLNELAPGVCPYHGFSVETAITFLLGLCVIATSRPKSPFQQLGPTVIGVSVILGHLVAMKLTGCGMNPARSFGPAVMALNFHNHWVYWAGPCTGALLAGLLHDLLLHPRWSCPGDWLVELKEVFLKERQKQPGNPELDGE